MRAPWLCAVACLAALMGYAGLAPGRADAAPAEESQACSPGGAKVVAAYKTASVEEAKKPGDAPPAHEQRVQLGDLVAIEVQNGKALASDACRRKVVLFLNGLALKGLPASPPAGAEPAVWKFTLKVTDESRENWSTLLGKPDFSERSLAASVGLPDQVPLPGDDAAVLKMKVLTIATVGGWAAMFVAMVAIFGWCAVSTNILRNPASAADLPAGAKPAFSLAKTQGAWWFFVILASYLLIGIVTGDFSNSLNGTALILLGIGAGTVLGSAAIDTSKATPEQRQAKADAAAQAQDVFQQLAAAVARTQEAQKIPGQAAQIPRSIATLPAQRQAAADALAEWRKATGQSEHFITDVLSDANGVNFHRFQMAVWTVVLGVIFVFDVYLTLAMPTFNATLMGLMGLSAGTYLGLKIPEPPKGPA